MEQLPKTITKDNVRKYYYSFPKIFNRPTNHCKKLDTLSAENQKTGSHLPAKNWSALG